MAPKTALSKLYACHSCKFATTNPRYLIKHSKIEIKGNGIQKFSICSFSTYSKHAYVKHNKNHHSDRHRKTVYEVITEVQPPKRRFKGVVRLGRHYLVTIDSMQQKSLVELEQSMLDEIFLQFERKWYIQKHFGFFRWKKTQNGCVCLYGNFPYLFNLILGYNSKRWSESPRMRVCTNFFSFFKTFSVKNTFFFYWLGRWWPSGRCRTPVSITRGTKGQMKGCTKSWLQCWRSGRSSAGRPSCKSLLCPGSSWGRKVWPCESEIRAVSTDWSR